MTTFWVIVCALSALSFAFLVWVFLHALGKDSTKGRSDNDFGDHL